MAEETRQKETISHICAFVLPYSGDRYVLTQKDAGYKVHPLCWTIQGGNFFYDMRQKPSHDNSPLETIAREVMEEYGVRAETAKEDLQTILGCTSDAIAAADAAYKPNRIPGWAQGFMALLGTQVLSRLKPKQDYIMRVSKEYLAVNNKPAINYIGSVFTAELDSEMFNAFAAMAEIATKRGEKLLTEGNGIFSVGAVELNSLDFGWGQDHVMADLTSHCIGKNKKVAVEALGHAPLPSYDDYLQKYRDVFTFRGA